MTRRQLFTYAAPSLPLAMLGLPMYVYLPKVYAELPLIGLTVAGLTLFAARLFDLASDPVVGWLADRYRHLVHPLAWIGTGIPITVTGVWMLFHPTPETGAPALFGYVVLTYAGWTLIGVPHYAWGAELVASERERQRLSTWREGAVLLGALLALFVAASAQQEAALHWMAWLVGLGLPISWITLWHLPRNPRRLVSTRTPHGPFWSRIGDNMRRLIGLHFFNALAAGIPATLFLLYAETTLALTGTQTGLLLLTYFAAGILGLPLWLNAAGRIGAVRAWRHAVWLAAVAFLPAVLLGPGDLLWFGLICVATGATLGADVALPAAIQARLANIESRRHGMPQEGSAFGAFGLAGKLALALAVGISLPLLEILRDTGVADPLPWMYALFPALIKLGVGLALTRWQIPLSPESDVSASKEAHDEKNHPTVDHTLRLSRSGM